MNFVLAEHFGVLCCPMVKSTKNMMILSNRNKTKKKKNKENTHRASHKNIKIQKSTIGWTQALHLIGQSTTLQHMKVLFQTGFVRPVTYVPREELALELYQNSKKKKNIRVWTLENFLQFLYLFSYISRPANLYSLDLCKKKKRKVTSHKKQQLW